MEKVFKKLFLLFCVLAFVFSCVGCNDNISVNSEIHNSVANDSSILNETLSNSFEIDETLIFELSNYLSNAFADYDVIESSFAAKIDYIKGGKKPLLLQFDSKNYYYACAYTDSTHKSENFNFCCVSDYIWVGFNNENEIMQTYDNKHFIVAFQINKTSLCEDLAQNSFCNYSVEHFMSYEPKFENGINVATEKTFNDTFIYLAQSGSSKIYICKYLFKSTVTHPIFDSNSFSCLIINKTAYVYTPYNVIYSDGSVYEFNLTEEFDEYYDYLNSVLILNEYSVTDNSNHVINYAIIKFENILNL